MVENDARLLALDVVPSISLFEGGVCNEAFYLLSDLISDQSAIIITSSALRFSR